PPILAVTSLNDTRVRYHEPAKWVARLRADSPSSAVLLKTEMEAGHSGPSGRYDVWREEAFVLAWILWRVGLAGERGSHPSAVPGCNPAVTLDPWSNRPSRPWRIPPGGGSSSCSPPGNGPPGRSPASSRCPGPPSRDTCAYCGTPASSGTAAKPSAASTPSIPARSRR